MGFDPVVIETDVAPASLNPLRCADYVERCVVSALYSPVLTLSSASGRSDRFEFAVAASRFSDGLAVNGSHVIQTLIDSASSPLWARHIRYLDMAEVDGDSITLTMGRPANFFPAMLGMVDFAPSHPSAQLGNGPYLLGERCDADDGYYHLTPNPHVPGASERPELVFVVATDVEGAPDRFRRGEVDITCSTAFPLDRLDQWQGSAALHTAPSGIHMQLEPNDAGRLAEPYARRALIECLDLKEVSASFSGGLRAAARGQIAVYPMRATALPSAIRIAYHDFYPNRQVLERLAGQWKQRLGISTELVERDYSDLSRDGVDASFVLRYSAFDHPYALFDQCATLMRDPAFDHLLQRFAADEPGSQAETELHLGTTLPVLRLFEVLGHWLANPRVTGFSWPSDSAFDFTRLRYTP